MPQYAKFLQTARRVLSSSIFEGDYEETHHHNSNRPDVMNNNYNDTERRNNNKISDKLMYKTANDILRDENDELRARIRQLESESQMNPQTLILEKMEQITEDQSFVIRKEISEFLNKFELVTYSTPTFSQSSFFKL